MLQKTKFDNIRSLYLLILALHTYKDYDLNVVSFDSHQLQELGFNSNLYIENFPEYFRHDKHVYSWGNYKSNKSGQGFGMTIITNNKKDNNILLFMYG